MAKPQTYSQWDLQEAITEHRTATRSAHTAVRLRLELVSGGNSVSSSSFTSSSGSPLPARTSSRQRAKAVEHAKPPYRIQIVEGLTVIKEIDTSILHPSNSEVRIVPPTRATILYPDPDVPTSADTGRAKTGLSRSKTQIDSQSSQFGSQNGSQKKKRSFLKLCFLSVGDLKTASHEFMRIGLRCTSLPTADNRATLSRTSSVVSVPPSLHSSQERDRASFTATGARPLPSQTTYTTTSTVPTALPTSRGSQSTLADVLKRTYSEAPPDPEQAARSKRRQTSLAHDVHSPSLLRRESSSADMLASPWTPAVSHASRRSLSRTSNPARLGSKSPYEHQPASPVKDATPVNDIDEPPPRRELPQSVTRHISLPSSQTEGSHSRSANGKAQRVAVAEMEVQTEEPFVEPETALLAGMNLFQELSGLKDRLIKECLTTTKLLGGGNGDTDKAEARLAARYALEFQSQFVAICARHTSSYLA